MLSRETFSKFHCSFPKYRSLPKINFRSWEFIFATSVGLVTILNTHIHFSLWTLWRVPGQTTVYPDWHVCCQSALIDLTFASRHNTHLNFTFHRNDDKRYTNSIIALSNLVLIIFHKWYKWPSLLPFWISKFLSVVLGIIQKKIVKEWKINYGMSRKLIMKWQVCIIKFL